MKTYRRFLPSALSACFYLLAAVALRANALTDTLPPLKDANEATLTRLVEERLRIALGIQGRFREQTENRKTEAIDAFRQRNTAKQDTTVSKAQLKALEKLLEEAQNQRTQWQKRLIKADETVNAIEVVSRMKPDDMRKNIPRIDKQTEALADLEVSIKPTELRPIAEVLGTSGRSGPDVVAPSAKPDTASTKNGKNRRDKYGDVTEKPKKAPRDTTASTAEKPKKAPRDTAEKPKKAPRDTSASTAEKPKKAPRDTADIGENKAPKNRKSTKPEPVPGPPRPVYAAYNPAKDVMLNPPTPPCEMGTERRDEFSGDVYREVRRTELFRHSTEAMLKFLKGRPHIVCEAALATSNTAVWLNLTFTITDPNAQRAFGGLPKGSIAVLKFIDGTTINAYNQRADEGTPDPNDGEVRVFRGQFLLDRTLLRKVQKTELDKIRIAWGTGYEDYPIYRVDALQHQARCFN